MIDKGARSMRLTWTGGLLLLAAFALGAFPVSPAQAQPIEEEEEDTLRGDPLAGKRFQIAPRGERRVNPQRTSPGTTTRDHRTITRPARPQVAQPSRPVIAAQGHVTLAPGLSVDLDIENSGKIAASDRADLKALLVGNRFYLGPADGAQAGRIGREKRGYAGCARADFSRAALPVPSAWTDYYMCIRTDEKKISEVHWRDTPSVGALDISYRTWTR